MKEKLIIRGGKPLRGTVSVSGAKNAAVAILPATILCEGECELDNLPNIDDVRLLNYLLCCMGAKTELKSNSIKVDTSNLNTYILKNDAVKLMRASYYFMGALLGRFGKAEVALPGGARATVELGLDAAAVDASGSAAARSIRALLRLSAIAVAAAFGACLLPVVALVRRDRARQARARREEHLAFSGVLANGIVHDFRNPMSSVRLDAQMLAREAARAGEARPGRMAELAGRISRTVERMDRVFQEFLYLGKSRGEALETVDLAACVHDCAETLAPRLEAAGVTGVHSRTS